VDRILLDRITVIKTKGLDLDQKKIIARDYLMPAILKEVGLKSNDVIFSDEIIKELAEKYTFEGGVRRLKEILFHLVRELNVLNLSRERLVDKKIKFPVKFDILDEIKTLLKDYRPVTHQKVNEEPKIGVVNGLWAGTMGVGGILPIELTTFPSSSAFTIKKTGSLEKVIQESIEVAQSVSWNYLDDATKEKWTKHWKDRTEGFHIHCPDGATPKDGPSAGTALSLLFYSFLTQTLIPNTLAITGEMNLQGKVTEIGGLKEKTFGAKTAGAKVVLYPKDNQKDMDKIVEENSDLVSEDFRVIPVDKFEEVIEIVKKMNSNSL
jgi:ATP-dependent Lon protease